MLSITIRVDVQGAAEAWISTDQGTRHVQGSAAMLGWVLACLPGDVVRALQEEQAQQMGYIEYELKEEPCTSAHASGT